MSALLLTLSVALTSTATTSSDAVLDAAAAAHRAAARGAVSILVNSKSGSASTSFRYRLAYIRPSTLRLEVVQVKPIAGTRTFFVSGGRIVAYDHDTNEVVRHELGGRGTLLQRAASAIGRIEDAVQVVFDPDLSDALFRRFRKLRGWSCTARGSLVTLRVRASKVAVEFDFDSRAHLLRGFSASTPGKSVRWALAYGPAPVRVTYAPPTYAKQVGYLSARMRPPKYADPQARRVASESVRAYDRLRRMEFDVDGPSGGGRVWMSDGRMAEAAPGLNWGFNGTTLWVVKGGRRAWQGETQIGNVGACLAALGLPTDAYAMQLLQRRNPMRQILVPDSRVREIGTVKLEGSMCDIIGVTCPQLRITACVRRRDHLIVQVTSEDIDAAGHRLSGTDRKVRYASVGVAIPASRFAPRIPAGVRPDKLPTVR